MWSLVGIGIVSVLGADIIASASLACTPPKGFECDAGALRGTRGDFMSSNVTVVEQELITKLQEFVERYSISVTYDAALMSYAVEHLWPLLHVLPGRLNVFPEPWARERAKHLLSDEQLAAASSLTSAELEEDLKANSAHIFVTCSDQLPFDPAFYTSTHSMQIFMLTHGDVEDPWWDGGALDPDCSTAISDPHCEPLLPAPFLPRPSCRPAVRA